MGYGVSEVYGLCPLSQLEKGPYVWDIKGYGLWQVWVIRSSTVCLSGQKGALAKVESEVNISVRHIAHDVQCIRSTMAIATVVWIKMSD